SSTVFYSLSLHDALPISSCRYVLVNKGVVIRSHASNGDLGLATTNSSSRILEKIKCEFPPDEQIGAVAVGAPGAVAAPSAADSRSEEHTSELQSRFDLVC